MEDIEIIKKNALRRLIRANVWGGKHTPLDFVKKAVAAHLSHKELKLVEKAIKALVNDGWILLAQKRTGKGSDVHVSLNPRKKPEMFHYLGLPPEKKD